MGDHDILRCGLVEERDEFEALEMALPDLRRLNRYERRAWSCQKRAVWEFMKNKVSMTWKI